MRCLSLIVLIAVGVDAGAANLADHWQASGEHGSPAAETRSELPVAARPTGPRCVATSAERLPAPPTAVLSFDGLSAYVRFFMALSRHASYDRSIPPAAGGTGVCHVSRAGGQQQGRQR